MVFEFSSHYELLFSLLETGIYAAGDAGAYTHIDDSRLRNRDGLLLANKRISGRKRRRGACRFRFCVYVAGQTRRADLAVARLRKICEELIPGDYEIEVIDVAKRPDLAKAHQVVATPTVLRNLPAPLRKSIGDFSNKEKALLGLGLFDFDHLQLG